LEEPSSEKLPHAWLGTGEGLLKHAKRIPSVVAAFASQAFRARAIAANASR
jgi:hypothetical protein